MRLGIDFGTCNSSAAFFDGDELISIKESALSNYLVPSCIFVAPNGKISVGKQADNRRRRDFSRYRNELKRYLGEQTPLRFGTSTLTPLEAVAEVIGKIKRDTDNFIKNTGRASLENVVITIPATYQKYKRDLMYQVALKAGFLTEHIELLDEPVAAGLYYARQEKMQEGEILLVYDLGGGTFDTALLQKHDNTFSFYKDTLPQGINPCGGVDFDQMIYRDLLVRHPDVRSLLDYDQDNEALLLTQANIGDACINVKHILSEEEEGEITIPLATAPAVLHYQLTRIAFNHMIAETIHRTIDCCRNMIQSANLTNAQISHLLLVGGSCRIPYVREKLEQEFHRPVYIAHDLELVVCQGAALYHEQGPAPSNERERGGTVILSNAWDVLKKKGS